MASAEPPLHEAHDPTRPYSIDFSIALEQKLDNEPDSPAPRANRQSLDPHVVESIITSLRSELAKEKEDKATLQEALAVAQSNAVELESSLEDTTAKCSDLQQSLEALQQKSRDDDDAISLLRSKVEESRRGLMRLQSESRRQSIAPIPVGGPTSKQNKRQSMNFTPMTGSGFSMPSSSAGRSMHRSTSSVSDASYILSNEPLSPSNQSFTFTENAPPPPNNPPSSSRRFSGLFGRSGNISPPREHGGLTRGLSTSPQPFDLPTDPAELESLRTQLAVLQQQITASKHALEETRNELTESNEAREASETCVNALREFIAQHGVGEQNQSQQEEIKLPPLPGQTTGEEEATPTTTTKPGGWGFKKLWGAAAVAPKHAPRISTSSIPRSSTSSIRSAGSATTPLPISHTMSSASHALSHSSSETSSFDEAEPVSPTSEGASAINPRILHEGMIATDFIVEEKTPIAVIRSPVAL